MQPAVNGCRVVAVIAGSTSGGGVGVAGRRSPRAERTRRAAGEPEALAIRAMIRSGRLDELDPQSGDWLFIDLGFSSKERTCGIAHGEGTPQCVTFGDLRRQVFQIAAAVRVPLNLLIEAPLSVAFNADGNPTGRSIEREGSQTRYWYYGLGCGVLVAATYLVRGLLDHPGPQPIRLFEGFVSFKQKGKKSHHGDDVQALRAVVWDRSRRAGAVCSPERLKLEATDRVESAFKVVGIDLGVPPVVIAMANTRMHPGGRRG
jgi:hypothetical protein